MDAWDYSRAGIWGNYKHKGGPLVLDADHCVITYRPLLTGQWSPSFANAFLLSDFTDFSKNKYCPHEKNGLVGSIKQVYHLFFWLFNAK